MDITLNDATNQAIKYLEAVIKGDDVRGPKLAKQSATMYCRRIEDFKASEDFVNMANLPIQEVPVDSLDAWLASFAPEGSAMRAQSISALRQIGKIVGIKFVGAHALKPGVNKKTKAEKAQTVRIYSQKDLSLLLSAPAERFGFQHPERNKAIVALIIGTMADYDELRLLRFEDIGETDILMRERPMVHDGSPENRFELPKGIMAAVRAHMNTVKMRFPDRKRALAGSTRLFMKNKNNNESLSDCQFYRIIRDAVKNVLGIDEENPKVGERVLRLSSARRFYGLGYDQDRIRRMLGLGEYIGAIEQSLLVDAPLLAQRKQALLRDRTYGREIQ